MKKFGSVVLVLVMVLTSVSALAGWVPEGFNPARGDVGGLISAEINKVNDRGVVTDRERLANLGTGWQKTARDGTLNKNAYAWRFFNATIKTNYDALIQDLLAAYPTQAAAITAYADALDVDGVATQAQLEAYANKYILFGDWQNLDSGSWINIAVYNKIIKALEDAIDAAP